MHTRSTQWMFVKWNYRLNFLNNYRGVEETDVSPCHSCIQFSHSSFSNRTPGFTGHVGAQWQTILSSFAVASWPHLGQWNVKGSDAHGVWGLPGHWEMVAEALGAAFFNLEMDATCWGGEGVQAWVRGWAHGLEPSAPKTICFILDFYLGEKQTVILLKALSWGLLSFYLKHNIRFSIITKFENCLSNQSKMNQVF